MNTLLVILAHPDDESFGPGGTLAKYASEGVAVHYLCGTRGESGTVDAELLNGYADVGELRTAELMCAAKELGLAGVHFLGYRDSGMVGSADNEHADSLFQAPLDDVAQRIIAKIDELRPSVILTHDQFGGYGHPDHIKLHHATLRAYQLKWGIHIDVSNWASMNKNPSVTVTGSHPDAPALFFPVFPRGLIKFGVRIMPLFGQDPRKFGRNKDIDLVKIASWELPITAKLNTKAHAETKIRASACHRSQQPPSTQRTSLFARLFFRRGQSTEWHSQVYPPVSPKRVSDRLM
ncbi:MAG: PIG-L family deacetylase [Anaerolineae bacterium]|nr:PIG-L family deacetylase [Anaerolineae bacterium]